MDQYVTKGHSTAAPGLRGHSVGSLYPYTVLAIGVNPTRYAAMDLRTGNTGHERATYRQAEIDIVALRVRNMMHG